MIKQAMLISALILGGAGAASAQETTSTTTTASTTTTVNVPSCSRTVTDKCVNRTAVKKKVVRSRHGSVVKKSTSTVTTKSS